jgi:hydrogenase-4 component F
MSFAVLTILLPLIAAVCLLGLGTPRQGATANLIFTLLLFGGTIAAVTAPGITLVHADSIGLSLGILTGFIGLTTAVSNRAFVRQHTDRMSTRRWRIHHAMCQLMLATILLGLYADNSFLLWLAAELAVIAGAVAISLPGTPDALLAGRAYFFPAAGALALAAFGTLVVYQAAQPLQLASLDALSFLALAGGHAQLLLAFVFLLGGYGALAALFPFQAWRAVSSTPLTTSIAALVPNLALLAILRFAHLIGPQASPLMLAAGLAGMIITAIRLTTAKDLMTGFVMILAPLVTTAAFQTLLAETPAPWLIAGALFAGAALPPSGLFAGVFIICGQTIQHRPMLAAPLILALLVSAIALLRRLPLTAFARPGRGSFTPALHLLLMLAIAFAMPRAFVHLLSAAAGLQ